MDDQQALDLCVRLGQNVGHIISRNNEHLTGVIDANNWAEISDMIEIERLKALQEGQTPTQHEIDALLSQHITQKLGDDHYDISEFVRCYWIKEPSEIIMVASHHDQFEDQEKWRLIGRFPDHDAAFATIEEEHFFVFGRDG
jgi:sulfur relay (sulfurtransferase) DsrC/TusE family protein